MSATNVQPSDADELPPDRPYLAVGRSDMAGVPDDGTRVSALRPYLLTSGRVEPTDHTLEIEAQVTTSGQGAAAYDRLSFEQRDIVALCAATLSVAEVAAKLRLHIGVARVLVADLAQLGYLVICRPSSLHSQDPKLIERVIRGLEAIR